MLAQLVELADLGGDRLGVVGLVGGGATGGGRTPTRSNLRFSLASICR